MMAAGREQRLVLATEGLSRSCRARAAPLPPHGHVSPHCERRAHTKPRRASQQCHACRFGDRLVPKATYRPATKPQSRQGGAAPATPPRPRVPTATSSPLTGFWCMESTKCRGFSMVYLRSRMVWEPVPSLHIPFLALFACSSSSASLLCSGLQGGGTETRSGQRHGTQRARGRAGRMLAGPACFIPGDIHLSGAFLDVLAL